MKLGSATRQYVAYKQRIGMVFETEAVILRAFTKRAGPRIPVRKITSEMVSRYLNGHGPITCFWHRKHDALSGFWRFAIQRGYTDWSPVPPQRPKKPTPFVPHIYTQEELRRLLDGTTTYQKKWCKLEPVSLRAILLLLYGAGLRVSEAINLTCTDVNLSDAMLTIRLTKFYKTRHVAFNPQLCRVLSEYDMNRRTKGFGRDAAEPFFTYKNGDPVKRSGIEDAFVRLRQHVGVCRQNARYQPRLHDLRHSFAVHRVIAWYRTGANVQRLLPALATYLGHIDLDATKHYLTMTPELLAEASLRFEGYAGEVLHA